AGVPAAARLAGCSRRRFSSLARAEAGDSFLAQLTAARLERAAELLASGRHSVTGTALATGFNDLSHFSHSF
ncbi:MAG: helix-turn-helix domain-containing protein, partial [Spiribacter salinus]